MNFALQSFWIFEGCAQDPLLCEEAGLQDRTYTGGSRGYQKKIGNVDRAFVHHFVVKSKLCIPSTLKTDPIFWHPQWIVTAVKY